LTHSLSGSLQEWPDWRPDEISYWLEDAHNWKEDYPQLGFKHSDECTLLSTHYFNLFFLASKDCDPTLCRRRRGIPGLCERLLSLQEALRQSQYACGLL
jgi:hypothetical protein